MTSIAQRVMQSQALPQIYERAWRPIAFTVAQMGRGTAAESRRISHLLDLRPDARVLDVACGPGNTTRRLLADLGPDGRVVGVDLAPGMVERARRDTADTRVEYHQADATQLPFDDGTFDAVTCLGALYLMPQPMEAIDEISRVLAPDGRAVVLTSVHRGPRPLRLLVDLAVHPIGGTVFTREEIADRFRANGLTVTAVEVAGVFQLVAASKPHA